MKARTRAACLSAAVTAALLSARSEARDLYWDHSPGDGVANDGTGVWNLTDQTWVIDGITGTNTAWVDGDNAFFGALGNSTPDTFSPYNVDISVDLAVGNMTFGEAFNNGVYDVSSLLGGTLTLNGNVAKNNDDGFLNFMTTTVLAAGSHTFTLRDTGGDGLEFENNGVISGTGGITLDNAAYEAWGTMGLQRANTYSGATNIVKGRIVLTNEQGLGATSAGTTIGDIGTLSIGGGTTTVGAMTIAEPITITRNTYAGGEYDRFKAAVIFANDGTNNTHTISGPLVVDSTDARIQVDSNTLIISSNITEGTTVAPGTGVLTLGGDFAGNVQLTGNNTGIGTGGLRLIGGVQLDVTNQNNLGGPSSPIRFEGNATLHPVAGFMTSFGSHTINNATFSGGLNVDSGHQFTVDQALGRPLGQTTDPVGSIGKRGLGTLNLNSPINLRGGQTFWDAGVVNVNSTLELHSLHLRSPIVNIGNGGSITTFTGYSALGQDSTGTNGGPDIAVVNITGNGSLTAANQDFNVSDNANTQGTLSLSDTASFTSAGPVFVAKQPGTFGTINQGGNSTVNITKTGNPSLAIGNLISTTAVATGTYNKTGGTLTVAGETFIGNENGGKGTFNHSGGTTTLNNWFAIGRFGADGIVDLSGGTITKQGGGDAYVGERATSVSVMTVRDTGKYIGNNQFWVANGGNSQGTLNLQTTGEFTSAGIFIVGRNSGAGTLNMSGSSKLTTGEMQVGQNGSSVGIVNVNDSASITINSWFAIGREGGNGTVNLNGGSITKAGSASNRIVIAAPVNRNDAVGVLNQTGGTLTNTTSETWVNEAAANGTWNFSGGTANLADLHVGQAGSGTATVNVSSTAALNAAVVRLNVGGTIASTINLNGGALKANQVIAGGGTGAKTLNLNGGLLKPGVSNTTNWMNGAITANVQAGGAKLDSNGFDARINTPLIHAAALGVTPDGGLTKSGTGSFILGAANTYTGGTTVNEGTLVAGHGDAFAGGALSVATGATAQAEAGLPKAVSLTTLTTAGTGKLDLTNNDLVVKNSTLAAVQGQLLSGFNSGTWDGPGIQSSSAATDPNGFTGLGYLSNADLGATEFSGVPVDADDVLVKYTYYGDADLSGNVTLDDYSQFLFGFQNPVPAQWSVGDFDYSGTVTLDDFSVFLLVYQNQGGPLGGLAEAIASDTGLSEGNRAAMMSAIAAVPEPGTLGVLAVAGAGLLARRRRR